MAVSVKEVGEVAETVGDAELAKSRGQESLDDLKKAVRERLSQDYAGVSREKLKRELLDKLEKGHEFEVPPGMVDAEFETIWSQFEEMRKENPDEVDDSKTDDAWLAAHPISPGTVLFLGFGKIPKPPCIDVFNGGRNGILIPLKGILTGNREGQDQR